MSNSVNSQEQPKGRKQARYWMLTIPAHDFVPYLPPGVDYCKGQMEKGENTGYLHWQCVAYTSVKRTLLWMRTVYGPYHFEMCRSEAAEAYVWKDDTYVEGTRFELGVKPFQRNNPKHWAQVWESAKEGKLLEICPSIRIPHYRTLRAIAGDFSRPIPMERTVFVFYGRTGSGKSRRAWDEAGMHAYPKDPQTKFWCGYSGQSHVVIDEFRGGVAISHLLRWLDRYPCIVEIKGASVPLCANKLWITSNLHPNRWYENLDSETLEALMRRLILIEFE